MQKFIAKLALFTLIQLAILSVICFNYSHRIRLGYMASFEDKIALLKKHEEPSLIVLGGSNVAFGIDSPRIENRLGIPVINAGLHGALGLDLYVAMAEEFAKEGDIVLLLPEWAMLSGIFAPQQIQLQQLLRESPIAWQMLTRSLDVKAKRFLDELALPEFAHLVQDGTKVRTEQVEQRLIHDARQPGIYSRLNFNEHGDFIGHHSFGTVKDIANIPCNVDFHGDAYRQAINKINALAKSLEKRGATLLFGYPPFPDPFSQEFEEQISTGHRFLSKHLNVPILHGPSKTSYPIDHFFDTVYHLNRKGKTKRTSLLIRSLSQHQQIAKNSGVRYK